MEKVIHKFKLGKEPNDLDYWLTKSEVERMEALESIRDLTIKLMNNGVKPGFQRVYTVTKRS
jgi:hypothetical protein